MRAISSWEVVNAVFGLLHDDDTMRRDALRMVSLRPSLFVPIVDINAFNKPSTFVVTRYCTCLGLRVSPYQLVIVLDCKSGLLFARCAEF